MHINRNITVILLILYFILTSAALGCGAPTPKISAEKSGLFASAKLLLNEDEMMQTFEEIAGAKTITEAYDISICGRPGESHFNVLLAMPDSILLSTVDSDGFLISGYMVDGITGDLLAAVPCSNQRICVVTLKLDPGSLRYRVFYSVISEDGLLDASVEIFEAFNRNVIDVESDGGSKLFLLLDDAILTLDIESGQCLEQKTKMKGLLDFAYFSEEYFIVIQADGNNGRQVSKYNPKNNKSSTLISYAKDDVSIAERVFVANRTSGKNILVASQMDISEYSTSDNPLTVLLSATDKGLTIFPEGGLLVMPNDKLILWGEYVFDSGNVGGLFEISFSESVPQKQIIRLAAAYNDSGSDVESLAFIFNRNNPRYQIEIMYYGAYEQISNIDTLKSAREDMILNVLGDSPPDLFYLPVSEISLLAERETLLDIAPAIDALTQSCRSYYALNALEASRIDGKQYWLSPFFKISGFMLLRDNVDLISNFTVNGMKEYANENEISLFARQNLFSFYPAFEVAFVDRKAGKTYFDSAECMELIQEIELSEGSSLDKGLIRFVTLGNFEDFIHEAQTSAADITMIGYPRGSREPPIISASMGLGVYCDSPNIEGAEEFLEFLLSPTVQSMSNSFGNGEVPLLITAMDAQINSYLPLVSDTFQHNSDFIGGAVSEGNSARPIPSDGTWEKAYKELLLSADGFYLPDDCLRLIFEEEMYDYLFGEKTAEEFLDILQNRAGIYIAERKQ